MVAAIFSSLLFTGNLESSVIILRRFAVAGSGGDVYHIEMLGIPFFFSFVASDNFVFIGELKQNTIQMLAI